MIFKILNEILKLVAYSLLIFTSSVIISIGKRETGIYRDYITIAVIAIIAVITSRGFI